MKPSTKPLLALSVIFALAACDGDNGKDGQAGINGEDGINGVNGNTGAKGLTSLLSQVSLPMGDPQCYFGGIALHSGVDINSDNQLSGVEVTQTNYVCQPSPLSAQGSALPHTALRSDLQNGDIAGSTFEIRNGGYGSDMVAHPTNKTQFYALTDRGPNATYTGEYGKGKKFPTPDYTPRIGLFELQSNGRVVKLKEILLKRPDGTPITGLPNSSDLGGTGETPYTAEGAPILVDNSQPYHEQDNPLKLDDYGLDGEGLVALKDGSFWVSDEYGPHIVHFDANGVELARINAFAEDNRVALHLPAEFANRRANRGMEGLAITPDEKTLVGIMQSTLYNPSKTVKDLDIVRIVTVNLETKAVGQYLYKQEKNQNSNSGIVALSDSEFLVIERDGAFYGTNPDAMKRIYKINLSDATNLEEIASSPLITQDNALGLVISGKTLEEVIMEQGWEALSDAGIVPVTKSLVLDLIDQVGYPHDKLEGMWLIDNTRLGVLNDDDFATWSTDGVLEQKYLDTGKTQVDSNRLFLFENLTLVTN
ncbi:MULTISPECIES: esterase-like activity of phytase family protein [unclassified Pseudoalteromonas]|uniref:esterase-like activity of phytase family protein n=1 Tax=unclassified Pseudoalteromonas TaxID=194690 RepID=UPI002097BC1C|nr:esterase-like activity of phytase family protein [Pseudoalteromonas sp. XMcav2-N]MCO7189491.1 esterase-like activity of phytase family protein [Pseudoalteromonas sp. XMcav2-N]